MFYFFTACTRVSQSDELAEKDSDDQLDYKFGHHYGLTTKKGMLAGLNDILTLPLPSLLVSFTKIHIVNISNCMLNILKVFHWI